MALIDFLEIHRARLPEARWVFHPANGMYRPNRTAVQLKKMGVRRGVPDLILPLHRRVEGRCYPGWVCELKGPEGRVSVAQSEWLAHFISEGWYVVVARSWPAAAASLLGFLGHEPAAFGLIESHCNRIERKHP